jgi:hypothetical protein
MFDKTRLAVRFSHVLRKVTQAPSPDLRKVAQAPSPDLALWDAFVDVFPWLANFSIKQDGSPLRWLAQDARDPSLDIVFPTVILAEKQVRDWILEYIEQRG